MLKKKVWQYQCEFCGKKNYSASHMTKHEKRCTMNPNRECGMCKMMIDIGTDQENNLDELKKIMPNPVYKGEFELVETLINTDELKEALEILKDQANNCPACILAVLRQKDIHPNAVDYDFKKECESFWSDWNAYQWEQSKPEFY